LVSILCVCFIILYRICYASFFGVSNHVLIIDENNLSGTIPNEIGHLSQLEVLSLRKNKIVGQIPESLYNNKNLKEILLSQNKLSGTLSSNLEVMISLEKMYIDGNDFTGPIPDALCRIDLMIDCVRNDGIGQACVCCKFCE